jgi:alpha-glucosidase (family GH31 glycosyl hydrolase)
MIARLKKLLLCSLIFFFGTSLKSQGHQIDVPNNNQLQAPSINPDDHSPGSTTENPSRASIGNITDYQTLNGEFIFTSNTDKVKVMFYTDDIFRIWLGPAGTFTDNADIVVYKQKPITTITSTNNTDYYKLESATCVLRVYKTPLRFALYRKDNATLVFEEESPLNYGTATVQRLKTGVQENFYGCGMQNGYFSHKGKTMKIAIDYQKWGDGSVSNPAPFYMSTAGYGAFRNTFSTGTYNFSSPGIYTHNEKRFDCYYFYGPSLKQILNGYTLITGRPFMIPRWGLEFGDADCYNKSPEVTTDVITKIADVYRQKDMPGGWILPNDGYGCGYQKLDYTVSELRKRGFRTGLWTEKGIPNVAYEVGTAGTRCIKLDVAYIGSGYRYALTEGEKAFQSIEKNCADRGFVWTVGGWAGTQRFSTIWSGDQAGGWEFIRFHIPTVLGSGLSAFNYATGDVDGIFDGTDKSYVRDLQWKCFTPAMMTISGWSSGSPTTDKQPWRRKAPYDGYCRNSLKLKMRLTPYIYSYCHEATETGVPMVRAMVLEYPDDATTWGTQTQYQFMSGEWFLVAPVYENSTIRKGIYLPKGQWIDYWDGTSYTGPTTLNNYNTPEDKLPLLVKAGAIIPMYPEMLYDGQKPKDPLTLDVYPSGQTNFTLYEDDGDTKEYRNGAFSKSIITSTTTPVITVNVGKSIGSYTGKPVSRKYEFQIHTPNKPKIVLLDNAAMTEYPSVSAWNSAKEGWYFSATDKKGIVYVKTNPISLDKDFEVKFSIGTAVNDRLDDEAITIYPNPTSGKFHMDGLKNNTTVEIRAYNIIGEQVICTRSTSKGQNETALEFGNQPAGVYFIHIITAHGTTIKKVVLDKNAD